MKQLILYVLVLLSLAVSVAAQPANPKKAAAMRPNLDIYVYRRCYTPDEKIQLNFSGFNEHVVHFAAYRLDLGAIVKKSTDLDNFGKTIIALDLQKQTPVASWNFSTGKIFPDQWAQLPVKVPKLPPGTYVMQASGGGVMKRTWLAVTNVALVTKQSRQELLVYATDAVFGRPIPGIHLALEDINGRQGDGVTNANGLLRIPTQSSHGSLWIYGDTGQGPAFSLSGKPGPLTPYTIYTYTDRPIYRPGNQVQYKTIIRQRIPGDAPGGFIYRPYANKTAVVDIRDATDALITHTTVTTNAYGTASGTFQLAQEPSLGAWALNVSVGSYTTYNNFNVQQYHKPVMTADVVIPEVHYLSGAKVPVTISAMYYDGQPVTDATVQYTVSCSGGGSIDNYTAKGMTDSKGEFHLLVPTQPLPQDGYLGITATITDLSRSSISATGGAALTAGLFQLSMSTAKPLYLVGKRITVVVNATDYNQKPVQTKVKVSMVETKEDRHHHTYEETTTHVIETGPNGTGDAYFSSPRPGYLQFNAEAFDSRNDKITAEAGTQVVSKIVRNPFVWPTLSLAANKQQYTPGETALVTLDTDLVHVPYIPAKKGMPAQIAHPDAWALVTVEGENLGLAEVVHLVHRRTVLRIPLTSKDFPSISLNVSLIENKQIYEQQQVLPVVRLNQKLTVSVSSDKPIYRPGQTASYTITTKNYLGQPVPAEVSLGVVDASIYAIAPDQTPPMGSFFYAGQNIHIQTDFSFAAQYSGGGYQNISAQSPGAAASGIRIRKRFADTAYWNPTVNTGPDGTATVSFVMPDNVTTWQATARAITMATAVGSATQKDIVNMPLLVHLVIPHFAVQNDQTMVSAIVQNGTKVAKSVAVHLSATGASLTGPLAQTLQLPPESQKRLDWRAQITGSGHATFTVSADGGPGARDADQLTMPIKPDGLQMVTASAQDLIVSGAQERVDLTNLPPGARITLTLSPSLVSAIYDALNQLEAAPSGNTEDTVSALLPDIAAVDALRTGGGQGNTPQWQDQLSKDVSLSLQKIYFYQHPDGGWNWWEFDQSSPDMTAYVLSVLLEAKQAGFTVDPQRLLRGVQSLSRAADGKHDAAKQVNWFLVLTEAGAANIKIDPAQLFKNRTKLGIYGEASLCMALSLLHTPQDKAMRQTLAAELVSHAVTEGRLTHWSPEPMDTSWRGDSVTLTAHVLRALLPIDPNSPLMMKAVNWLMENRDGDCWDSSRASAEAVLALAAFVQSQSQAAGLNNARQADYTAHVALDGVDIQSVPVTDQNIFGKPITIKLTSQMLAGHKALTVTKRGTGVLYLSEVITSLLPPDQAVAQSHGITVSRQYGITVTDPSSAHSIASGSVINVQLHIDAASTYRHVRLEDPLPAGCVVDSTSDGNMGYPIDYSDGYVGYTREEEWDDRVVFYFDTLPQGMTQLSYSLSAVFPGAYQILPAVARLHYFPEVRGNSGLVRVRIRNRP